jgi:hypothetical protein
MDWCAVCSIEFQTGEREGEHFNMAGGLHASRYGTLYRYRPNGGVLEVDGIRYAPNPDSHNNQAMISIRIDDEHGGARMRCDLPPMTDRQTRRFLDTGHIEVDDDHPWGPGWQPLGYTRDFRVGGMVSWA